MAGGGRGTPVGRNFPSTASRSTWLTDACRAAAAAARRPRRGRLASASRCWTRRMSPIESSCRTRSPSIGASSISAASTRSAGCCMSASPGPRTPCWCPATTGVPPGSNRAARRTSCASSRTSSTVRPQPGDPVRRGRTLGAGPADGEQNPLRDSVVEAVWPVDPLAARRGDVERGAALVAAAMSADTSTEPSRRRHRGLGRRRRCAAGRACPRRAAARPRAARPAVGQRPGGTGPRPGGRGAAADASAADTSRPACVAGQRVSRLGSAVLRRRVAVRSRRLARRRGLRRR